MIGSQRFLNTFVFSLFTFIFAFSIAQAVGAESSAPPQIKAPAKSDPVSPVPPPAEPETAKKENSDANAFKSAGTAGTQEGTRVKDSQIFWTLYTPQAGSASDFLFTRLVELEKALKAGEKMSVKESKVNDEKVRKIVAATLDLESLAKGALASHWPKLKGKADVARRAKYTKLFKQLVEENAIRKAREYVGSNYQITFEKEEPIAGTKDHRISARVKKKDVDVMVEFRVSNETISPAIKGWGILDVKLDENSLEAIYRSSFNRIITKNGGLKVGFPELLTAMEKRLQDLKKGKASSL